MSVGGSAEQRAHFAQLDKGVSVTAERRPCACVPAFPRSYGSRSRRTRRALRIDDDGNSGESSSPRSATTRTHALTLTEGKGHTIARSVDAQQRQLHRSLGVCIVGSGSKSSIHSDAADVLRGGGTGFGGRW